MTMSIDWDMDAVAGRRDQFHVTSQRGLVPVRAVHVGRSNNRTAAEI